MKDIKKRKIYVISGPAGVGKSTTSKQLVSTLERSSYISGDRISHIPVNGRGKPWLCEETNSLTWVNIQSLAENLIKFSYDVVIDYVTFPKEIDWLKKQFKDHDIELKYIVLMVDQTTLISRDKMRREEYQMGERSLILLKEFKNESIDSKFILDTSNKDINKLDDIVHDIKTNKKFIYS
jgi:predicted kinase